MRPDVPAGMTLDPLPFFDPEAAWAGYDAAARAMPACSHNQAWKALGPGRGQPPDCTENRSWRAEVAAAKQAWRAAQANAREGSHAA